MSNIETRAGVLAWLSANWTATPILDLTNVIDAGDLPAGQWLGVEFPGAEDEIASNGPPTCYLEDGIIILNMVEPIAAPIDQALANAADLKGRMLAAKRIDAAGGSVIVRSISSPSDANGVAIRFNGAWHGFAMIASYEREYKI